MSSQTHPGVTPELLRDLVALEQLYVPPPESLPGSEERKKQCQDVLVRELHANRHLEETLKYIKDIIARARAADAYEEGAKMPDRGVAASHPTSAESSYPLRSASRVFASDAAPARAADRPPYVAVA